MIISFGCPLILLALSLGVTHQRAPEDSPQNLEELQRLLSEKEQAWREHLKEEREIDADVVALMARDRARDVPGAENHAYRLATYSFSYQSRDDVLLTHNDWDLLYGSGGPWLSVRMGYREVSTIWDLGPTSYDDLELPNPLPESVSDRRQVFVDHVYLVHVQEELSDFWVKLEVFDRTKEDIIVFRWDFVEASPEIEALERREGWFLRKGVVRLQLRNGGGSGEAHLSMDGTVSHHVDDVSTSPLDLETMPELDEDCVASVQGGHIPNDKAWVIRRIDYEGIAGDSEGGGTVSIVVAGNRIAALKDHGPFEGSWTGRLPMRAGEEDLVYVVLHGRGTLDVTFKGDLEKVEAQAEAPTFEGAVSVPRETLNSVVRALDKRAAELRRILSGREELKVRTFALPSRDSLRSLGAESTPSWRSSTFNFRYGTRDDAEVCGNSWDLHFSGEDHALSVVDSMSRIWDLGRVPLERALQRDPKLYRAARSASIREGHTYLIHGEDRDEDIWALCQALESRRGHWVILRWKTVEGAESFERFEGPWIKGRKIRLQIRSDQRVKRASNLTLHRKTYGDVDVLEREPLDLDAEEPDAYVRAYCEGGFIPASRKFLVEKVDVRYAHGCDEGVESGVLLKIGDETLMEIRSFDRGEGKKNWKGPWVIEPGQEKWVLLESLGTAWADVILRGRLVKR